jgi:hypothetical protein
MRISVRELAVFKPKNNMVLCENILETDKTKLGNTEIYVDNLFRPEFHQPVVQKVIAINKHLIYGREYQLVRTEHGRKGVPEYKLGGVKNPDFNFWYETSMEDSPVENSMPWKTDMECRVGDVIWADFVSVFNAAKRGRTLECEGRTYYLIPYNDIYCLTNDNGFKILNGWVFIEPIEYLKDKSQRMADEIGFSIVGKRKREAPEDRYGIVRHIGKPVEEYLNLDQADTNEISVGDVVMMKFAFNRRLESHYHLKFSDKNLISSRRPWIAAIIRDSLFPMNT